MIHNECTCLMHTFRLLWSFCWLPFFRESNFISRRMTFLYLWWLLSIQECELQIFQTHTSHIFQAFCRNVHWDIENLKVLNISWCSNSAFRHFRLIYRNVLEFLFNNTVPGDKTKHETESRTNVRQATLPRKYLCAQRVEWIILRSMAVVKDTEKSPEYWFLLRNAERVWKWRQREIALVVFFNKNFERSLQVSLKLFMEFYFENKIIQILEMLWPYFLNKVKDPSTEPVTTNVFRAF